MGEISFSPLKPQAGFQWGPRLEPFSGISLLHLSWGHPRRALPVILALWSPDFPHLEPFGFQPRLSNLVAKDIVHETGPIVKSPCKFF